MNYNQYLLFKLAEECNEIAQMAIKTALFGENSVDPREDTGETNMEKLSRELLDVSAVLDELNRDGPFTDCDWNEDYVESKRYKLRQYFNNSVSKEYN